MPTVGSLALYVPVVLVMAFTPGPATLFVLSRSASQGRRAGFLSAAGLLSGTLVLIVLAAVGLTNVLAASPRAFEAVKAVGAAYVIYLGVRAIAATGGAVEDGPTVRGQSGWRLFRDGILTELLNPKSALFYASILPQFVDTRRSDVPLQMVILGVVFVVFAALSLTLIAIFAAALKTLLMGSSAWRTVTRWASGLILVGLGLRLAVSKAR
jgi:threonine/homoserine/homoserine lactone efflux protein